MINTPISREWHHIYKQEEEIQRILDHFNLSGIDTELFDQDYLEGDHYWESASLETAADQEYNAATTVIPSRVQ